MPSGSSRLSRAQRLALVAVANACYAERNGVARPRPTPDVALDVILRNQVDDDAYDTTVGSKHILIENGFSMIMDDAFAFYGGASGLVLYGSIPAAKHVRFEDVNFVATSTSSP